MNPKVAYKPQCPQCGSNSIEDKWVKKTETVIVQPVPLKDWAKQLISNRAQLHTICGTLDRPHLGINQYSQIVLSCKDCGFTETFDVPGVVPKKVDISIPIEALQIWCRNGEVCDDATPCDRLACAFKKDKNDLITGIMKCRSYVLTLPASNWASACHLPEETTIFFG